MRAADGLAGTGQRQYLRLADVIAELLQLRHHLREARPARLRDVVELVHERPVEDIDIVAENMDFAQRMMRAELNSRNDAYALARVHASLVKMADAPHRIVVGDGHIPESGILGCRHQFLRRQPAIGIGGVHMQIACHSS